MVNHNSPQPYYSLSLIQALVEAGHYVVVNPRANNRLQDLGWNNSKLKSFISALNASHFVNRYPQCEFGKNRIDCDGYKMRFAEEYEIEDAQNGIEIFIKLADKNHCKTLIISFHLDGSPG